MGTLASIRGSFSFVRPPLKESTEASNKFSHCLYNVVPSAIPPNVLSVFDKVNWALIGPFTDT